MNFVNYILPIVVGALTHSGFEMLQKLIGAIDKLPAVVKRIVVGALSFGLVALASVLGVQLTSTDFVSLNSADFQALLGAGLAFLFHLATKQKSATPKVEGLLTNRGTSRVSMLALLIVGALFGLGVTACSASPVEPDSGNVMHAPRVALSVTMAGNAVQVSAPCTIDEPGVKCRMVITGQFNGAPIVFGTVNDVAKDASFSVSASVACTPLAVASIRVELYAVNRSGDLSDAQILTGEGKCTDPKPGAPRSNLSVTIVSTP